MKFISKFSLILAFVVSISSCSDNNFDNTPFNSTDLTPICLSAEYPSATRASDAGFENGDKMGVYVLDFTGDIPEDINDKTAHAQNVQFKFDGSNNSWSGVTTLYWTPDTPADIIGYYPMIASVEDATSIPFNVARRQDTSRSGSQPGGYEASDFLWGHVEKAMPTSDKVDLMLGHVMAGIRVSLKEGTGFAEDEWNSIEKNVMIPNTVLSSTIDLTSGKVNLGKDSPITITPLEVNGDWRGVVVPQTITSGNNLITVTVDGVVYNLTKTADFSYIGGKLHTFTIEVNKRTESGSFEFILAGETVTKWIDDDIEFRDGIMREYVIVDIPTKGSLASTIKSLGIDPSEVINLKLTGEINEDDFEYIRENFEYISALNIKDATVYDGDQKDVIPGIAMRDVITLSHLVFPNKLKKIGHEAFRHTGLIGSLIIPEGVVELGWACFMSTEFAGELSLPSTLETIDGGVFQWGPKFSGELRLPSNLKTIGGGAFNGCKFSGELILPETLEYIGESSFCENYFSGDLVIPQSVKVIMESAFVNIPFTGNLTLSKGLTQLENHTFGGCGFKGELVIPSTVKSIGDGCFANNKFSKIIFSDNIKMIGTYCFEGCNRLSGSLEIPKNITVIKGCSFKGCSLLDEVIIGENVAKIEGGAFDECYNISSIIVNNPEPPLMTRWDMDQYHAMPFERVSKDNFTVQVPQESVEAYRHATYWSEFKRIAAYSNFVCRPAAVCALNSAHSETITLNSDGDWEIKSKPEWCTLSSTSGSGKTQITLTVNALAQNSQNREDKVVFALKGTDVTTDCCVSQYNYEYGEDKCVSLQTHSKGNGIDILFLGDGFDAKSIAEGEYMSLVKEQMKAFFGVEPYSSYKDYFNVYACIGLSQENGVNTSNTWRNTRFKTLYAGGMLMHENVDDVFDYAVANTPLSKDKMSKSLIIMALNSDEYGSATTILESGASIAICCKSSDPYPMDTRGIIQHEACGHAFGKLAEERVSRNAYAPSSVKNTISSMHARGWYQNVSLNGNLKTVHWADMVFDPRYSVKVDIFEGGCEYSRDIFRCEINSCMNYGIPYFSAISRRDIVKRILEYSGESFTNDKFYALDSDKWGDTGTTRAVMVGDRQAYSNSGKHHEVKYIKSKKY